jgi:hypothetical protein
VSSSVTRRARNCRAGISFHRRRRRDSFSIGLSHYAWGLPLPPRLNTGVICSIPQNDSAATILQSDCASLALAVLRTSAGDAVSAFSFFSFPFVVFFSFCTCNKGALGLINRVNRNVLT